MIKPPRQARNSLGTMLLLSAIDVLLCSFTAGVALFLMGSSDQAGHGMARGGLTNTYIFVDSLGTEGTARDRNLAYIRRILNMLKYHVDIGDEQPPDSLSVTTGPRCKGEQRGLSWSFVCDPGLGGGRAAGLQSKNALSIQVRIVSTGIDVVCNATMIAGSSIDVYARVPQLRLNDLGPVSGAQQTGPAKIGAVKAGATCRNNAG
jgi:hypothetical protein